MRRWLPALALALVFAVPVAAAESDLDLVALPGGLAWIGDAEGGPDEALHQVEVAPFHLMRHEVTNRQFGAFVAATGHRTDAEKHGGGFGNNPDGLRIGLRHDNPPDTPLDMVGIRCAASAF